MKCAICGRNLTRPKVTMGAMNLGPKCAAREGFIEGPRPKGAPLFNRMAVVRDKRTPDLFDQNAGF